MLQNLEESSELTGKKGKLGTISTGHGRASASNYTVTATKNYLSVESGANTQLSDETVAVITWICVPPANWAEENLFHQFTCFSPFDDNFLRQSGIGVRNVNSPMNSGSLLLLFLARASTRFHAQLELMKRVKEKRFTVDTFTLIIGYDVQNREKGWYVSNTGRENSRSFLNEGVSTLSAVFSGGASASYDFDHSRIVTPQISSSLTLNDKNDLAVTSFQELH